MSDIIGRTVGRNIGRPVGRRLSAGLTESDQELLPYLDEEDKKRERRAKLLQPLEWVFDRLQTGQYISANVANEFAEYFTNQDDKVLSDLGGVIREGISGKRKGSYEDVLRDTLKTGMGKLFPNAPDEKRRSQWDWADILGFIGDVALDPLTYVNPLGGVLPKAGASKGALKAADAYALDTVKVALKQLGLNYWDEGGGALAKFASKSFDPAKYNNYLQESAEKAFAYFKKNAKKDIRHQLNQIYKDAYEDALLKPADELRKTMESRISMNIPSETGLMPYTDKLAEVGQGRMDSGSFDSTLKRIYDKLGVAYEGAGGRQPVKIFGYEPELFHKEGAGVVARSFSQVKRRVKDTKAYGRFSDAWSWYMDNSIIGKIRKEMGFRNPYEKAVRIQELENAGLGIREKYVHDVVSATRKMDDRQQEAWVKLNAMAEELSEARKTGKNIGKDIMTPGEPGPRMYGQDDIVTPFHLLQSPDIQAQLGLKDTDIEELSKYGRAIWQMTRDWRDEAGKLVNEGIINDFGDIENYLPINLRRSSVAGADTSGLSFTRKRKLGLAGNMESQAKMIGHLFGLDAKKAMQLVTQADASDIHMNLSEMLMIRGLAQAKMMRRANIVRMAREFGVPLEGMHQLSKVGLVEGADNALKGYLFDADVAGVLNRAVSMTEPDQVSGFRELFTKYMSWWRAAAVATPGFHARNFADNQTTGFLKHGFKWFTSTDKDIDALAAVIYSKFGSNPGNVLQKLGLDEKVYNRVLGKRYGSKNLRQLADEELHSGLISQAIHGYAPDEIIQNITKKKTFLQKTSPFSQKNVVFETSHDLGYVLENHSKMKSYLIDLQDVMGDVADIDMAPQAIEEAQDWARRQAKQYWIDYEDLTDTEKAIKNIIPFYCVPDYSQILTKKGWLYVDDLVVGDVVLTYSIENDQYEWEPVDEVAIFDHDQELDVLENKRHRLEFTSDHRWVVKKPSHKTTHEYGTYSYPEKIEVKRGYELNKNMNILNVSEYMGKESSLTPEQARLLGWLLTDGYFRWRGNHCEAMIYQHPSKYLDEVIDVAGGKPRTPHPDSGVVCVPVLKEKVAEIKHLLKRDKREGSWVDVVTSLSRKAMDAMYDAMYKADGVMSENRTQDFFSCALNGVGATFEVLATLLGKRVVKNQRGFSVSSRRSLKVGGCSRTKSHFVGRVWCPKTHNGTWVMKQNGMITITGNTFTRRNIPRQISMILMYPQIYSLFPKIEELATYEDDEWNPKFLPDWVKQEAMFPIGRSSEGQINMFRPDMGMADLNFLPILIDPETARPRFDLRETINDIGSMTSPLVQAAASAMTEKGYDFFYRDELTNQRKAPFLMRLFVSKPETMTALDGFLRYVGKEDGLEMDIDDNGKLVINPRLAVNLERFLPIIRQMDRIVYAGFEAAEMAGIPLEENVEAFTNAEDEYEGIEQTFQVLSFMTGIKIYPQDTGELEDRYNKEVYYDAMAARTEDRRGTPEFERRSLDRMRSTDERIRRLGL